MTHITKKEKIKSINQSVNILSYAQKLTTQLANSVCRTWRETKIRKQ